ncbi:hypothetical protein [Agrobacterium radiobacter]|uniref:hypothetical protein n=1 Tax=Agrobacterium radiobacter TaxID=362 RepID=UPI003F84CC38
MMRFRRWHRPEPYGDTSRKRAAFLRKQRLERETLPLFAADIAAGHRIEIKARGECCVADIALIERLAQAVDTRPVRVQRIVSVTVIVRAQS